MSNQDSNIITPDFKDISTSSLIYDLPQIINYNNNISKKCLEHIYNFSGNYITKPVRTSGIVAANNAEFNFIKIGYGGSIGLQIDPSVAERAFVDNRVVIDHSLTIHKDVSAHSFDAIYDSSSNKSLTNTLNDISVRIENVKTDNSTLSQQLYDISLRLNNIIEMINNIQTA